jgi:hypothetical protein
MGASDFGRAIVKKLASWDKILSDEVDDFLILLWYQEKAL